MVFQLSCGIDQIIAFEGVASPYLPKLDIVLLFVTDSVV